jgi:hypothetical protein
LKLLTIKHRTTEKKPKRKLSQEAKDRKNLRIRLLNLWVLRVKEIAGYQCEICRSGKCLQAHHIIGKSNRTLKWDLRNGICLCANCHSLGNMSAHQDPQWFMLWMYEFKTEDYEYLIYKKNERFDKDYIRIEDELKEAQ